MTPHAILHVDMDAFYAAIEVLDHPEWAGRPLVVGAAPDRRGVVSTCSYEARKFGIHSAMPSRTAGKLCPHAIFVPPRMGRYAEISRLIMGIFNDFTPLVEPLSLDEAFLDIRGAVHLWGDAVSLARALKAAIRNQTGLTASVGLAPNKFLAKIASDLEKPDGLTLVPETEEKIIAFLAPLPVGKLWGVGKVSSARLEQAGIRTIAQLQAMDRPGLERFFGPAGALHIGELVRGHDDRTVVTHWEEKSLSNEHTFDRDEPDQEKVRQRLLELAEQVGGRLRDAGKVARTVQIKVRFSDFKTITRQMQLTSPADSDRELIASALALYAREQVDQAIRLVGFGVCRFATPSDAIPVQHELFANPTAPSPDPRNRKLDKAVDSLRKVFGADAVRRGG